MNLLMYAAASNPCLYSAVKIYFSVFFLIAGIIAGFIGVLIYRHQVLLLRLTGLAGVAFGWSAIGLALLAGIAENRGVCEFKPNNIAVFILAVIAIGAIGFQSKLLYKKYKRAKAR